MSRHFIGTTNNGKEIYANLLQRPLSAQISRNPHLLALVKEAAGSLSPAQATLIVEKDMGRTIGYSEHLVTQENDYIFYARQLKSEAFTRFVKNRKSVATSILTFRLEEDADGNYEITDVWIGKNYPPSPDESDDEALSKEYWSTHAVVFNGQPIMASTVSKECPY
jgi:hypothetical protein